MKSSSTAALLATTLFVLLLFSVAEDVHPEPCDSHVTEHSQLADHSKFISCDYDGPNMTIAWQRPSTEPYYHLQIEYQCFNESLEDISELNKKNNKIALSYYYVLTNSGLESVKITNSTCIISGCVKEEGVNNNAMWMDTTVCFPPATADVSVLSSGSVILSTMSSWSGSGSVIPSTMSSWSGYSTMSTSYSISTLPPSVEATTILPTSFYIIILVPSLVVVLLPAIILFVALNLLRERRKKKRYDDVEIEAIDPIFSFTEIFQGKDEDETITLYHHLENSPPVTSSATFPRAASEGSRRKEMSKTPACEELPTLPSMEVLPKFLAKKSIEEYVHYDFEKIGDEIEDQSWI